MTERTSELLREVLELPPGERRDFVTQLLEAREFETHGFATSELADSWDEEIGRRLADIDSGKVKLVPWEEVRKRMHMDEHCPQSI